jgi:hypothetical protein
MAHEGYRITQEQKDQLAKPATYDGVSYFNPVPDENNDWFIFDVEGEYCINELGWGLTLSEFHHPPEQ